MPKSWQGTRPVPPGERFNLFHLFYQVQIRSGRRKNCALSPTH
jgi:hypothetical protein